MKTERNQINKIQNEKGDKTIDTAEIYIYIYKKWILKIWQPRRNKQISRNMCVYA